MSFPPIVTHELEGWILFWAELAPVPGPAAALAEARREVAARARATHTADKLAAYPAAAAVRKLDSPFVMFMAYMGAKSQSSNISVHRDDVVMVYKGQEYKMPSVEEWRKEYNGATNDVNLYTRLGKESLAQSNEVLAVQLEL